jgi:hypothetical protein
VWSALRIGYSNTASAKLRQAVPSRPPEEAILCKNIAKILTLAAKRNIIRAI